MMRRTHRQFIAVAILAGTSLALMGGPASAAPSVSDCTQHLVEAKNGSLTLTGGTSDAVPAGTNINLIATWSSVTWSEKATLLVCTTTNGTLNAASSTSFPVIGDEGTYTVPFAVPPDVPGGTDICVRGVLAGHRADGTDGSETSNELCFRTASVSSPSTTTTSTTAATSPAPAEATTTTTTAPAVVTTAGATTAPGLSTGVLPTVRTAPAPRPELPRTGSPIELLGGLGSGAAAIGSLARFGARRGRRSGRR